MVRQKVPVRGLAGCQVGLDSRMCGGRFCRPRWPLLCDPTAASGSRDPLLIFRLMWRIPAEYFPTRRTENSEQLKGITEGIVMSGSARWRFGAIIGTGVLLAAGAMTPALAQTYPSGSVRVLVPYG